MAPPVGAGAAWTGPATRSARPAGADPDPPTDPHGFPPIPAEGSWSGPARTPDPAEASALAGAFAVDYLSWDEDDPDRRGRVLLDYLSSAGSDPARLGWSGVGRQRAEFALPGLVRPDGDGRVLVDVRVRVTPYRSVGDHTAETPDPAEPDPPVAGVPAVAPAPTGRGWRSLASCWIRLSVPVTSNGSRLVVDAWEETLGEQAPPAAVPAPRPHEHALADDDPLVEPGAGGWPVTPLRAPVIVGLGRGVGTSTVAAALHAYEGGDRDAAADVVVCADPERATTVVTDRAGRLPLLAVTGAGHPRSRAVESRFGAVVVLPHVERWAGLARPSDELAALLGQPFDHLPRSLQDYAGALRLLAAALVRSGQLTDPTPPRALRPRAVALWRGLQPVERTAVIRPVLLTPRPQDSWDDDTLEASGAGRAG